MHNKRITELLPHRDPFLFVDEIISATKEEVIAVNTFSDENDWIKKSFPNHYYVPGTLLIESMVQCGGAGVRLLGTANGIFALVSIENVSFSEGVEYNKQVRFIIKNSKISDKLIKQYGLAYIDNRQVMEANWISVKMPTK